MNHDRHSYVDTTLRARRAFAGVRHAARHRASPSLSSFPPNLMVRAGGLRYRCVNSHASTLPAGRDGGADIIRQGPFCGPAGGHFVAAFLPKQNWNSGGRAYALISFNLDLWHYGISQTLSDNRLFRHSTRGTSRTSTWDCGHGRIAVNRCWPR